MPILLQSLQSARGPDAGQRPSAGTPADGDGELRDGELTLLIGPVGAGKSSLLRTLAGVVPPVSGQVYYDGQPLWRGRRAAPTLLLRVGLVFQSPEQQLFARTVQGEFHYSLRPYHLPPDLIAARTAAALAGTGLNTRILSQSPWYLSGGQRRRLAVATTLATATDWLFLDEPTAGLDALALPQLLQTLQQLRNERREQGRGGLVVATHDLDALLPIADRVWLWANGRLRWTGTPAQLVEQEALCQAYGVGPTEVQATRRALLAAGVDLPGELWQAEGLAAAVAASLQFPANQLPTLDADRPWDAAAALECPASDALPPALAAEGTRLAEPSPLDARARWLCCSLLTLGVLAQTHPLGVLFGVLLAAGMCLRARTPVSAWRRVTLPYTWMTAFSTLFAGLYWQPATGLSWHGLGFAIPAALTTLQALLRLYAVVLLGLWLTSGSSYLALQQGLAHTLRHLERWRVPVAPLALGAGLVLRFIPCIGQELERFSQIARARGKSRARAGALRASDLPVVMIPLLAALFQLAEDLALALEARGLRQWPAAPPADPEARWHSAEWRAVAGAVLALACLLALREVLPVC
ncbi:MAG: ATP-binding cassette domain-containing protein [Alicyclobacillus sp.]|nr:ATP-binding cassette domain-containing protein [Alicyclobacillus sp.]